MTSVSVDPSDPHNDQVLAQTVDDLKIHTAMVRSIVEQAEEQDAPLSAIVALVAITWIDDKTMTRDRLASLLALSMVKDHAQTLQREGEEFNEFLKTIKGE